MELERAIDWLHTRKSVDSAVYSELLKKCGDANTLVQGRRVHEHITESGREHETYIGNCMIEMYGKCARPDLARRAFEGILERNVFSWNLMIAAFARTGHVMEAFRVVRELDLEGVKPTRVTFLATLDCCRRSKELNIGLQIHSRASETGVASHLVVSTALVNMYGRCSPSTEAACKVFYAMESKDVVAWNTMMVVHSQKGECEEAVRIYQQMLLEGWKPDKYVLSTAVFACSRRTLAREGRNIHMHVRESSMEHHIPVANALIHMYGKQGELVSARRVFDRMNDKDIISWTSILTVYSQGGEGQAALELLNKMDMGKVRVDRFGYTSIIEIYTSLGEIDKGRAMHAKAAGEGLSSETSVGSALVNLYGKCGLIEEAVEVFVKIKDKDRCAWTSMLGAYVQHGLSTEAFNLFQNMDLEGVEMDSIAVITVLNVCSGSNSFRGRVIHRSICGTRLELDDPVVTALVDMYSRSGSLSRARDVFESAGNKGSFLWSALISGYSQHGDLRTSIKLFREMQLDGVEPDSRTVTSVLSSFSHGGFIDKALAWFSTVVGSMEAASDHYMCMVDLLGRAGCLEDAERVLESMPCRADSVAWTTLMGSCVTHGDVYRGAKAAGYMQNRDSSSSKPF